MKNNLKVLFFILLGCILTNFILQSFQRQEICQEMLIMGTVCRISIITNDNFTKEQAYDVQNKAFAILTDYQNRWSFFSDNSELALVNANAAIKSVELSEDTFEIIERALEFSDLTGGAFDIAATSLGQQAGHDTIVLNAKERAVNFSNKKTKIDLGAIATGYAVDRVVDFFGKNEVANYLIDIGGDIYCSGKNIKNQIWRVGVRSPEDNQIVLEDFPLINQAVTTSGNYVKSHIIDPKSSVLAKSNIESVTVIAKSCLDADVLATSFFIMGIEKTKAFIDNYQKNIQVFFVVSKDKKSEIIKYNWQKGM